MTKLYSFSKSMRLRKRYHYLRMNRRASRIVGQWILIDMLITHAPTSRLGITVTKRFGEAFQRNRFKRLVREAFRHLRAQFIPTVDLVVRPRTQALQAKMSDLQQELKLLVEQGYLALKNLGSSN